MEERWRAMGAVGVLPLHETRDQAQMKACLRPILPYLLTFRLALPILPTLPTYPTYST